MLLKCKIEFSAFTSLATSVGAKLWAAEQGGTLLKDGANQPMQKQIILWILPNLFFSPLWWQYFSAAFGTRWHLWKTATVEQCAANSLLCIGEKKKNGAATELAVPQNTFIEVSLVVSAS